MGITHMGMGMVQRPMAMRMAPERPGVNGHAKLPLEW